MKHYIWNVGEGKMVEAKWCTPRWRCKSKRDLLGNPIFYICDSTPKKHFERTCKCSDAVYN